MKSSYDVTESPLVLARVPLLPLRTAIAVYGEHDPARTAYTLLCNDTDARLALSVASPSLDAALDIGGSRKAELRALAYVLRMSARCTPYGLFASVGCVETGAVTSLAIGDRNTQSRVDAQVVGEFADRLERSDEKRALRWKTNSCIIVDGPDLRITDVRKGNRVARAARTWIDQRAIKLRRNDAIDFVCRYCETARPYAELIAALSATFSVEAQRCVRLVDQLIDASLLVSELRTDPWTDPAQALCDAQRSEPVAGVTPLLALQEAARCFDGAASADERLKAARSSFALTNAAGVDATPLMVSSKLCLHGTIARSVLDDAMLGAELLLRTGRRVSLETFRRRFSERYEGTDRVVPLLEVVDPHIGIDLSDGTELYGNGNDNRYERIAEVIAEAVRSGAQEIDTEAYEKLFFAELAEGAVRPRSCEALFRVHRSSASEHTLIMQYVSEFALKTAARFLPLFDGAVHKKATALLNYEEQPGIIRAELCYAPVEARSANVLARPKLLERSLRLGSGADDSALDLDPKDVFVGIDASGFFLYSKSLQARVELRETHSFRTPQYAPNLCRFLSLLAYENVQLPHLYLGEGVERSIHLPRLRYRNIILAARRWRFNASAFGKTTAQISENFRRKQDVWNLPRWLFLKDEDNRLLLDSQSPVFAELLAHHISGSAAVVFEEALIEEHHQIAGDERGAYLTEFVVQGVDASVRTSKEALQPTIVDERAGYSPGSRWIYAKCYLPEDREDAFCAGPLAGLAEELETLGKIDRWFFLRYADTQRHVRVRFHAADGCVDLLERIVAQLDAFLDCGWLKRWALDTYEPEYERYGTATIDAAEAFFTHDSRTVCQALGKRYSRFDDRVLACAASFDAFLQAPQLSSAVVSVFESVSRGKLPEADRQSLKTLRAQAFVDHDGAALLELAIHGADGKRRLNSFVHMHCNRFGIRGEDEARVVKLLRSAALGRSERVVQK